MFQKKCEGCKMKFKNCIVKKNPNFINFDQHKNFYDFSNESIVDEFLKSVYGRFLPDGDQCKIMRYAEIINYQPSKIVESKSTRMWFTNVYTATHFNSFIRGEIGYEILKRIIVNGETGNSWIFKRFNRLQITFSSKRNDKIICFIILFFHHTQKNMNFTKISSCVFFSMMI